MPRLLPQNMLADLNYLMCESEGFTVTFLLEGGHALKNVALVPNHDDKGMALKPGDQVIQGEIGHRPRAGGVRIIVDQVVAYFVEKV